MRFLGFFLFYILASVLYTCFSMYIHVVCVPLPIQFFLTLHYHAQDYASSSEQPLVVRPEVDTILQLRRQDPEFAELEGNIFSSVSTAFLILAENFQDKLVDLVVSGFKSGCKKYWKESWHLVEGEDPQSAWQEVSPSLSSLLPPLQHQLAFLKEHVAVLLFPTIFNRVTNQIDQILLLEVQFPCTHVPMLMVDIHLIMYTFYYRLYCRHTLEGEGLIN